MEGTLVSFGGMGVVVSGWGSQSVGTLCNDRSTHQVCWTCGWFPYVSFPLGVCV